MLHDSRYTFLALCIGNYDLSAFQDTEAIAVIDTLTDGYDTILAAMRE